MNDVFVDKCWDCHNPVNRCVCRRVYWLLGAYAAVLACVGVAVVLAVRWLL